MIAATYSSTSSARSRSLARVLASSLGAGATAAAERKLLLYEPLLLAHGGRLDFAPFSFETLGGLHSSARGFLRRLQTLFRDMTLVSDSVPSHSVTCRISYAIAAGVGISLSARRG